ncbi:MAG TPA: isovaleryl-CoA dehydrogenase [Hyphomicrobiaceae bacterium]|nr:isovaleryl-CoA dehydrogenase [Hyphomicrobiaceae bacterium]
MTSPFATHEVLNQSPPFEDVNLFLTDRALQDAVKREGGSSALERLAALGAWAGSREALELGRLANEHPPRLRTHDAKGRRLDVVEFHPAYHALMQHSMAEGLHCAAWERTPAAASTAAGANVIRAAAFYLTAQVEAGHCCPITMTSAAVPTLMLQADIAEAWLPRIMARTYDRRFVPAVQKSAVTLGMGMTEKQGGTDVRTNTTRAEPVANGGPGGEYRLTGHKWFMSAPMCDAFLVLAQAPAGLSCFLLPRFLPDGSVNAVRLQRLKDKLGNRSNASAEVEFQGASAWLIGEEGRGVANIIEMVSCTRLDCAVASAALMRHALASAVHHCRHRSVFGRTLADQPLMMQVLADLALEVEAATGLIFHLAASFDRAPEPVAAAWRRLMTPVSKYWVCKSAQAVIGEAMECLGGNGYVEESLLPRLYREAPVNSIWEGSGNVMALDVLRVLQREADAVRIVLDDLEHLIGGDAALKAALERIRAVLYEPRLLDARARALTEALALTAAGALLRAHGPRVVADPFIATRLAGPPRQTFGQNLERADLKAILARALPE